MGITAIIPTNLDFPHRGELERDDFVLAQETAQDLLAGSYTNALNQYATELNITQTDINTKWTDVKNQAVDGGYSQTYINANFVNKNINQDIAGVKNFESIKYISLEPSLKVKPTLNLDFANQEYSYYTVPNGKTSAPLASIITGTRSTTKTYVDATGKIRIADINVRPIDFNPATGEGGVRIEEARTNLLLNSEALSTQSVTLTAVAHTLHFTGTGQIAISGNATGTLIGTGLGEANRVTLTFTPTSGVVTFTVTGTVANAQLEVGSASSSYIPTTSAQATRAADSVVRTLGDEFNPNEFSFFVDLQTISVSPNSPYIFDASNGTNQQRILMFKASATALPTAGYVLRFTVNGTTATIINPAAVFDTKKIMITVSSTKVSAYADGVKLADYTNVIGIPAIDRVHLGSAYTNTSHNNSVFNGFKIYPKALSDEVCIALTRL